MSRKKRAGRGHKPAPGAPLERRTFALRFARNVAFWILPVALVWLLVSPFYNRFLTRATENLVRLVESPSVTRLAFQPSHDFLVTRTDVPSPKAGYLYRVRVTDAHFPLIMLGAFFLAVPGVGWRRRLEPLGWALLISVFFHLLLLFCWVKFVYATQLGSWTAAHYGAFGRNFWGMSKHLLDLPFKFAMPLILWAFFYLRLLLPKT